MSKNDVTGDNIQTKVASNAYRNNFDAIFRKPKIVNESDNGENHESKEIVESTVLVILPTE
jgi:hypothetical protein